MALVLSRKQEESIVIGDEVTVTVVEISKGRVRLSVDAPPNITIHRKEIWLPIPEEASAGVNRVATPEGESGRQVANTQDA